MKILGQSGQPSELFHFKAICNLLNRFFAQLTDTILSN
jgi:hypothetical protein